VTSRSGAAICQPVVLEVHVRQGIPKKPRTNESGQHRSSQDRSGQHRSSHDHRTGGARSRIVDDGTLSMRSANWDITEVAAVVLGRVRVRRVTYCMFRISLRGVGGN
jgi:hypothetical protein